MSWTLVVDILEGDFCSLWALSRCCVFLNYLVERREPLSLDFVRDALLWHFRWTPDPLLPADVSDWSREQREIRSQSFGTVVIPSIDVVMMGIWSLKWDLREVNMRATKRNFAQRLARQYVNRLVPYSKNVDKPSDSRNHYKMCTCIRCNHDRRLIRVANLSAK